MVGLKKITALMPYRMVKEMDELIRKKGYSSYNELIRIAVLDLLKNETEWHI